LGCTMYALFAGGPPFTGESPFAIAHQHLTASPEPLRTRRPEVAAELEALVAELLAKNPASRPSNAAAVHQRIAAAAGDPALAAPPAPRSPAPPAWVSPDAMSPAAQPTAVPVDEPATQPQVPSASASVPALPLGAGANRRSRKGAGAVLAAVLAV